MEICEAREVRRKARAKVSRRNNILASGKALLIDRVNNTSRELFLDDLKTLDATLATAIMNPGDVAEISNGEVKIRR